MEITVPTPRDSAVAFRVQDTDEMDMVGVTIWKSGVVAQSTSNFSERIVSFEVTRNVGVPSQEKPCKNVADDVVVELVLVVVEPPSPRAVPHRFERIEETRRFV